MDQFMLHAYTLFQHSLTLLLPESNCEKQANKAASMHVFLGIDLCMYSVKVTNQQTLKDQQNLNQEMKDSLFIYVCQLLIFYLFIFVSHYVFVCMQIQQCWCRVIHFPICVGCCLSVVIFFPWFCCCFGMLNHLVACGGL